MTLPNFPFPLKSKGAAITGRAGWEQWGARVACGDTTVAVFYAQTEALALALAAHFVATVTEHGK